MTTEGSGRPTLEDVDFEAFYQGGSLVEGTDSALSTPPWDIGVPQPAVVELEASGLISGDVLDAGCGLGNNALFLAERGYRVTGVDGAPTAIAQARRRAGDRGLDIEYTVADVTSLDGFDGRFDTVLDSALYHCLNVQQRRQYADALYRCTRPGARLHVFCFPADSVLGLATFGITEEDLRENFGRNWHITRLDRTRYTTTFSREDFATMVASVLPEAAVNNADLTALDVDEQGKVRPEVWRLTAERSG